MLRIYTMEFCPYCKKLKDLLDGDGIEYTEINVDLPENEKEFTKLVEFANDSSVPMVIVGKNVLVPEKAFNTIDECFDLIKRLNK